MSSGVWIDKISDSPVWLCRCGNIRPASMDCCGSCDVHRPGSDEPTVEELQVIYKGSKAAPDISTMTSHELARRLFAQPDLPLATYAHGHTYLSKTERQSHGPLRIARLHTYDGGYIIIGNMYRKNLNGSPARGGNWWITACLDQDIYGVLPDD